MDASYELLGQLFEWEVEKAKANLRKHGLSFETACEVFFDPFVRLIDAGSDEESRDAAVGFSEDSRLLFVVHLIREGERIRIISARMATAREREEYESE
jgi:uncharacterized DUF497 family protein